MSCLGVIDGHEGGHEVGATGAFAHALADELVLASQLLADLAYDLGGDADTLRRHMTSIQAIDKITQMQLAIADLLRTGRCDAETLAALPLQDMVDRLIVAMGARTEATTD